MKSREIQERFKSESTNHTYENTIRIVEPIAPGSMARQLVSFSVTVDSVVATANIVVDDSHRHLSLHWGDDQVEVINLSRLRNQTPSVGETQAPNTLKFQHAYREPFNKGRRILVAVTEDSEGKRAYDSAVIEIEQRHRLTFRNIVLEFPDHLDSSFETVSEVEVDLRAVQNSRVFFHNTWDEDVVTAPQIGNGAPIRLVLNNSAFTHEIAYSDDAVSLQLYLSERDGISENEVIDAIWDVLSAPFRALQYLPSRFDTDSVINLVTVPFDIHPRTTSRSTRSTAVFRIPDREGKVYAHFNYDLDLVVPVDRSLERKMTVSQ